MPLAIIIVDHGSRSAESNRLLHELVDQFLLLFKDRYPIVEPAHMELTEPSIASAMSRCVERGADEVIVCPFFLAPGKHMREDIPRLAAEAAARCSVANHSVAPPLGIDELMLELLDKRVQQAIAGTQPAKVAG